MGSRDVCILIICEVEMNLNISVWIFDDCRNAVLWIERVVGFFKAKQCFGFLYFF